MPATLVKQPYTETLTLSVWRLEPGEGGFAAFGDDPAAALREAIANTPDAPKINGIVVDTALTSGVAIAGEPVVYHVDRPPERDSYWFVFGPPAVVE